MFSNAHKVSCALFIKNEYSNWGLKIGERHTHDSTVDNEEEEVEKEEEAEAKNEKKKFFKMNMNHILGSLNTAVAIAIALYPFNFLCTRSKTNKVNQLNSRHESV